ncbi:hypothetical protein J3F83DRAFT_117833 [Trichoderma novae-zelandiae]
MIRRSAIMDVCPSPPQISASASDTAPVASPASPASTASSDALSIRQIARLYARERILISPISWTGRHVELLGCSFEEPIPASSNTSIEFPPEHDGSVCVKSYLRDWWRYGVRLRALPRILALPECPLRPCRGGMLYFDRLKKELKCTFLHYRDRAPFSNARSWPVAAYADLEFIESLRIDTIQPYTTTQYNPPGEAIFLRKWKKLEPPNPLRDPYVVALLIAVA